MATTNFGQLTDLHKTVWASRVALESMRDMQFVTGISDSYMGVVKKRNCDSCGGPVQRHFTKCEYCGGPA